MMDNIQSTDQELKVESSLQSEVMTESASTSLDVTTTQDSTVDRQPSLAALTNETQEIQCGANDVDSFYDVNAKLVTIKCSDASGSDSDTASNKVRVSQVSKFDWEQKLYFGNLVACNHKYIAYVVKVKASGNNQVRILNHTTSSRTLLKCFEGKVPDLAFAGPESNQLACIDDFNNLRVFNINDVDGNVEYEQKHHLILTDDEDSYGNNDCRVFWSILLPDSHTSSAQSHDANLIAVTYGNSVDVLDLKQIPSNNENVALAIDELSTGVIRIQDGHEKTITKVVISPEGNVMATSSLDGFVKFWQLDFEITEKPECLHDWKPHDGEPVDELIFCDNQYDKREEAPPMWRFLITGTKKNSEIKLWCAVNWTVLQTLRFDGESSEGNIDLRNAAFKITMDLSGTYLLLSDVTRHVLYVLNFVQDADEGIAYFDKLSEFVLTQPLLSFVIHQVKHIANKSSKDDINGHTNDSMMNGVHDKSEENIDENDIGNDGQCLSTMIRIFGVHTRALQQLQINCLPSPNSSVMNAPSVSTTATQEDFTSVNDLSLSESSSVADSSNVASNAALSNSSVRSTLTEKLNFALESLGLSSSTNAPIENDEAEQQRPISIQSNVVKAPEDELPDILASSASATIKIPSVDVCAEQEQEPSPIQSSPPDMVQHNVKQDEENPVDVITHEQHITSQDVSNSVVSSTPISSTPASSIDMMYEGAAASTIGTKSVITTTTKLTKTESFEQSPVKSVNIPSEATVKPVQDKHSCCSDALRAMREENKDMRNMLMQIMETMASQQELITNTMNEQLKEREAIKLDFKLISKSSSSHFSKTAKELTKNINTKLDAHFNEMKYGSQEREAHLLQTFSAPLLATIKEKTVSTIKEGMRESILPTLNNTIRSSMDKVNAEVVVKMSSIEKKVREDMENIAKSKDVSNAFAQSCSNAMHKTITSTFRDEIRNNLVPSFNKTSNLMLSQLNNAFSSGTSEYLRQLESHLGNIKTDQTKGQEPLAKDLRKAVDLLQKNTDSKLTVKDISKEMTNHFANFVKAFEKSQKNTIDIIQEKIGKMFSEFSETVAGKISEHPEEDHEAEIYALIQDDQIPKAFELALSLTNLPILSHTCDLVDPKTLFNSTAAPLPQAIILSLIQQLSADLSNETPKKTNWLQNAIFALDPDDPMTMMHITDIIDALLKQIAIVKDEKLQINDDQSKLHIKALRQLSIIAGGARVQ